MAFGNRFLFLCLCALSLITADIPETCDANSGGDESCQTAAEATTRPTRTKTKSNPMRFFSSTSYCTGTTSNGVSDLYRHGGSAQAYKPNVPVSSVVCPKQVADEFRYKASSWPFTRRTTRKGTAPTMDVTFQLWSCRPKIDKDNNSSNNNKGGDVTACACSPLENSNTDGASLSASMEVWQTLPDGRYTSLRPSSSDDGDICRATVRVDQEGQAKFSTVAPGSVGIMNGMGPFGADNSPYGKPVIHTLVKAPHHAPLLLDIPILPHHKTLEERKFSMESLDFRGLAWSRRKSKGEPPYKIASWKPNKEENHIDIEVNIYLELTPADDDDDDGSPDIDFCPSLYLFPGSFFLEPISICARSMLDFFPL